MRYLKPLNKFVRHLKHFRKYEYENFTCTLLLKGTARSCAIAVRSFNVEVSRVSQQVSQSSIGEMRLKFWEDLVEKCFTKDVKNVPQHPVAVELFKVNCDSVYVEFVKVRDMKCRVKDMCKRNKHDQKYRY